MEPNVTKPRMLQIQKGPPGSGGALLVSRCAVADGFFSRLVGLLGRSSIAEDEGLLLKDSRDIHMWGMRFAIDAVFLRRLEGQNADRGWEVTSVRENLRPWRVLPVADARAEDTLEVAGGACARWGLRKGDTLCIA